MMWCHGENWDGGQAEELRLVEGTCNVYVTTGRTLDGRWYAHTVVPPPWHPRTPRAVLSSSLTTDTHFALCGFCLSIRRTLTLVLVGKARRCRLVGKICLPCDTRNGWQGLSRGSCERTVILCDGIARCACVGLFVFIVDRASLH